MQTNKQSKQRAWSFSKKTSSGNKTNKKHCVEKDKELTKPGTGFFANRKRERFLHGKSHEITRNQTQQIAKRNPW
jgi:hypothetical protein